MLFEFFVQINEKLCIPEKLIVKIFKSMVQSQVCSQATIMSLPLEVDYMIIKWLPLTDALNMAKALKLPEQVAVQYFAFEEDDIEDGGFNYCFKDLQPGSFKFLLKNKSFQFEADSYEI